MSTEIQHHLATIMITFPNAKINLGLNIVRKRPDGYHDLETLFYPIPLADALETTLLAEGNDKYRLHQSGLEIAGEADKNLVIRAYRLLDELYHLPPVDIHLLKQIPSGAGLGGGSADAAFMLKMLDKQFGLSLSEEALEEYAARLGADCAFFIKNRPTYAEGIGNLFSPVALSLKGYQLLLVKPDIFVSTREAFACIVLRRPSCPLKEVIQRPVSEWRICMINDFEESVFPQFPAIRAIKEEIYRLGATYAAMSGSGSSVFGLFAPDAPLPEDVGDLFGPKAFVYRGVLE